MSSQLPEEVLAQAIEDWAGDAPDLAAALDEAGATFDAELEDQGATVAPEEEVSLEEVTPVAVPDQSPPT